MVLTQPLHLCTYCSNVPGAHLKSLTRRGCDAEIRCGRVLFTVSDPEVRTDMNSEVPNVVVVTGAVGGVGFAEPTTPSRAKRIPSPRNTLRAKRRTAPRLVPETAAAADSTFLEFDHAPGFTMTGRTFVGRGPIADMSVSPHGVVFVTNRTDNSVSQMQAETLAVLATSIGTNEPFVVKSSDSRVFVSTASATFDSVTVIDARTGTIVATYPLAGTVRDLAVSPDGFRVYVARTGIDGADVAVIDTVTGAISRIDLGTRRETTAEAITISRDNAWVYVASVNHLGSELVVIDTRDHRVTGWRAFATAIRSIAVSPDGATVYVGGHDSKIGAHVDIVEARTCRVAHTVAIGGPATQLLLSSGGDRVYVVNGRQIAVMCAATREIIATVSLDTEPTCINESCDGKRIFIADYDGRVTAYSVASTTEPAAPALRGLPMAAPERV